MLSINQSLLVFIVNTSALALLYFYTFSQTRQKYIGLLALSCSAYALNFVFDVIQYRAEISDIVLTWKMIAALAGSYFLLSAIRSFQGKKNSSSAMFILISFILWANIISLLDYSFILTILPLVILNVLFSLACSLQFLINEWDQDGLEKSIAGWAILFIGLHRSYYPFIKTEISFSQLEYTSATLLMIILNICMLIIYFQRSHKDLTERERQYRLLAENARDFIYQFTLIPEYRFSYASPASTVITGFSPDDFYQHPELFIEHIHQDDRPHHASSMDIFTKIGDSSIFRWIHKDGSVIWVEQNNTVIRDENNEIIAFEGILRDISERKNTEDRIRKIEESRRNLIANISHDLRTPITTIQGYVQAIIDEVITDKETVSCYLKLVLSKAIGLNRLIQDLFDLSQLETGHISLELGLVDVEELAVDIRKKYELDVNAAGITLLVRNYASREDNGMQQLQVIIDIDRINQVFANLINNSIRHTQAGGIIEIDIHAQKESSSADEYIIISVKDSGEGIDPDDLPFIFDRFFKCSKNRSSMDSGRGLGLAICKDIIELHRGYIFAESTIGKGSIFSFTLPIYIDNKEHADKSVPVT